MAEYIIKSDVTAKLMIAYTDLGLADQAALETLIDILITYWRGQIDAFCGRDFQEHDHTTTAKIYSIGRRNRPHIEIHAPVITEIASVVVKTRGGKDDSWETEDVDTYDLSEFDDVDVPKSDMCFLLRLETNSSAALLYTNDPGNIASRRNQAMWSNGYKNVSVAYKYGYSSTPDAIKQINVQLVIMDMMNMVREHRSKVKKFTATAALFSVREVFMPGSILMPESVQFLLRPWMTSWGKVGVL